MISAIGGITFLTHPLLAGATLAVTYAFILVIKALLHPLRNVPGPFWGRFTRLWYLRAVTKGDFEKQNINLHRTHGSIVRIAPGQYSLDDPEAIRTIYSHSSPFLKAPWYLASGRSNAEVCDLFTDLDPRRHSINRRKVASLYSMTSLVQMESCVVDCTALLEQQLSKLASLGQSFDLQQWMQFYAFDVIGLITVNKRFGFLDSGIDENALIESLHTFLLYAANVGIFAEWHPILSRILALFPSSGMRHLVAFAERQIGQGQEKLEAKGSYAQSSASFLEKLLGMHYQSQGKISMADLFTTCITNIGAGSDSTSISLTAILYNIFKHPTVYEKLREEIDQAHAQGLVSARAITFRESQSLLYLQACIKEGMRMFPATGLPLARVVPKGGATLCGRVFPEGEIVGVNTWVIHRNRSVFGEDADSFRPERWLEESPERVLEMERNFLAFGAGARTCIGKNISLMEISKLIPDLIRRFDFELVDMAAPLKTQNVWFVKQLDIKCRVRFRQMV
ncbi:cytochrome P450 [Aspergillus pseudodeflectus]|uniref:Cytochrome P450 n=1 Tax=Aspergillus pseudodeflectus TaxID=176178 RepID=A0ABR4JFS0_9EURO